MGLAVLRAPTLEADFTRLVELGPTKFADLISAGGCQH